MKQGGRSQAGVMPRSVFKQGAVVCTKGVSSLCTRSAHHLSFVLSPFHHPQPLFLPRLLECTLLSDPPSLPPFPFPHPESTIPEPDLAKPECYTLTTHDQQFGSDPIPMAVRSEAGWEGGRKKREDCVRLCV